jgi:long-chain acyl-CoA synthetase
MQRQSLVEFVTEFSQHANDGAIAYRRGYRMERRKYGNVLQEACRFARELEAQNIRKGDAVMLWGENSPEWLSAFFGCVLRGAIVVPIDRGSTFESASRVSREVQAKFLVRSRNTPDGTFPFPSVLTESLSEHIARHSPSAYVSPQISRQDPVQVIFTSGTTGEPRGVVISHGNVLATIEPLEREIQKYIRYEKLVHPLRLLNLVPLSHVFGQLLGLFIPHLLRAEVIFVDSFKPSEVVETVRREGASVLVAVPRLLESLQREIESRVEAQGQLEEFQRNLAAAEREHFLLRWWRFRRIRSRFGWKFWAFVSGGAALPQSTETFWNRLGYAVIQGYGMTETTSLITVNHPFQTGKGSIGKVFPGMEVRVDESGEIAVRGENIASTYRHGQELKPVLQQDGWFRTGDLGEIGRDGRLYFKGRQKNVIVTPAGMNVYPEDLENALRAQQAVRDCVVFGLEDEGNAEPCAVLLLQNQGTPTDGSRVVERANQSLAEYQKIRHWFQWPEPDFPRTPTHKPLLRRIREVTEAHIGRRSVAPDGNSLAELVERITRKPASFHSPRVGLDTQLNLSSLDRVELMSALEDRYQIDLSEVKFSEAETVGQLEQVLKNRPVAEMRHAYPTWPQNWLITGIRLIAYYLLTWPATYLLAAPKIIGREKLPDVHGPVLVISNHVTDIDIGWILAALPARFRHRLATAIGGERLTSMRRPPTTMHAFERFMQRLNYFLVLALFNVFPLPRQSGFLNSFSFAGSLADRHWNILIFPEGHTTENGLLAPFRSGIGLLATRLNVPVVPMRLDGLYELKQALRKFALPGRITVTIGHPLRFSADQDPDEIARELERSVAQM